MSASRPELLTESLMALPDLVFFELLRNWIGPISTPYRKQDLLDDLRSRMTEPERRARILALLDSQDVLILWALNAAGSAGLDAISRVVRPENPAAVHRGLVNLQDRLLIYRSDRDGRYRINPWFADDIEDLVRADPCESWDRQQIGQKADRLGCLVVALCSLAREDGRIRRRDGELRQGFVDQVRSRFGPAQADMTPIVLHALEATGILRADSVAGPGTYRLSEAALSELISMDGIQLVSVLLAAAEDRAALAGRATAWEQVLKVLSCGPTERRTAERLGQLAYVVHGSERPFQLEPSLELGVLGELAPGTIGLVPPGERDQSSMADSSLQLVLGPDTDRASVLALSRHTRLVRLEFSSVWEVTRDAVYRWLQNGADIAEILAAVARLVDPVPEVLEASLRDWSASFAGARWYRGIVLAISEDRRAMLVHDKDFQNLEPKELAPGIYLIRDERAELLAGFAERNGLPAPPLPTGLVVEEPETTGLPLGVRPQPHQLGLPPQFPSGGEGNDSGERIRTELDRALEAVAGQISDAALSEARVRIQRRLIVDQEQIGWIETITEGLEARGLDYSAKVRVIETALRDTGSILEITRSVAGERKLSLLEPTELKRDGQSMMLLGREAERPEQLVRIDVSKISRVRRLRGSLTGGPLR